MNIFKRLKCLLYVALCVVTIIGSMPVSQIAAAQSQNVGLLEHTDWNFKLYNNFDKYPDGYTFAKDRDISCLDENPANKAGDMDVTSVAYAGYDSTTALSIKINTNTNQYFNILPTANNGYKTDFTGAKEFWVWMDTTKMQKTFRKLFFGVLTGDGKTYQTDDLDGRSDMTYYMQDGNGGWVEKNFDTDGCMEDIGNYKGFIRFSTDYFVNDTTAHTPVNLSNVTGIKVWYDLNDSTGGEGESFLVDHIGFAGPSIDGKDCNVGDFCNSSIVLPSQLPGVNFDNNNIRLTYGAISDLHVGNDTTNAAATKVKNALSELRQKAVSDNVNLDAVLAVGDLTDYGMVNMYSNLATVVKGSLDLSKTRFVAALGNHDYYDNLNNKSPNLGGNWLVNAFGNGDANTGKNLIYPGATDQEIQNADYHTTVNGYDFIVVNCAQYEGGVKYSQTDLDWLKQQLANAAAAHPNQPIFVASHPTITGTTYAGNHAGSYYNSTDLYPILKQYHQVIYFSGHTHYNLNDEKDIWQGDFTTVGTAAVYYGCVDTTDDDGDKVYGVNDDDPVDCDQFSQGLYVQVDRNNNVKLTRMDFYHGKEIKRAWVIPAPNSQYANKYYTALRGQDNSAPSFSAGATVRLDKADLDKETISLSFDAATDDDMVKGYIISFVDKNTGNVIKKIPVYSDFYIYPQVADMPKSLSFTFNKSALAPFTADYANDYTIQVTAFDSWNAKSAPISSATISGTPPDPTRNQNRVGIDPHNTWNFKLYNNFDKYPNCYTFTDGNDLSTITDGLTDMNVNSQSAVGYNASTALSVKINTNKNQSFIVLPTANNGYKTDFTGAKEFWAWIDTTNMQKTFRKLFFGVLGADGNVYQTDDMDGNSNMTYYIQDGNGGWIEKNFDTDGCIEGIGNYKGFIRFSTDYLVNGTTTNTPVNLSNIAGVKVWYDLNDTTGGEGETFVVDHIGFSGPSVADNDCNVGDLFKASTTILPSQLPKVNFDSSNIKLTYGAISDLHISDSTTGDAATKVKNAISQLNQKAVGDKVNLDAILAVGDLTDFGKPEMYSNLAAVIKDSLNLSKTRFVAALGNHDYYDNTINKAPNLGGNWLVNAFGNGDTNAGKNLIYPGATDQEIQNADYHTVINGYDFIIVNCAQYDGGVKYNQTDLDWLKQQLTNAAAAHPGQPIFVASHPTITGTTYAGNHAGDYYNGTDLYAVLKQYPQVVYFSGHTHYNLNDEKDIWQGDFTTVGTAAVYYGCVDTTDDDGNQVYGVNGDDPEDYDKFSQGLYVQVDGNNNVKLTRMDFYHGKEIKTAWVIPAPNSTYANQYYTPLRGQDNTAPSFNTGASVKLDKADADKGTISLTFDAASDNDMVKGYIVSFVDKSTGNIIKKIPVYSDFYEYPQVADMPKSLSVTFNSGALAPFTADYEKDYTIQVTAFDSWNAKSAPISSDVIPGTPPDPSKNQNKAGADFHGNWDFKLYNDFNSFPVGYTPILDSDAHPNGDYNGWPDPSECSVSQEPVQSNGYKGSTAFTTKIRSTASEYTVYFPSDGHNYKTEFNGAKEFWVWVDFSNVTFRKVAFGVRTAKYGDSVQYITDDDDGQTDMYAYIQNGSGGWTPVNFDTDGCLEQFGGYKGFIRFPISYLHCGQNELDPATIQAFYLWMSPASDDMVGKTFTFDEVGFAGPTMDDNDGTLNKLFDIVPTLASISLDSTAYSMTQGNTHQTVATAVYSDGSKIDVSNFAAYTSSNPGVATVNPSGLVAATGVGQTVITAVYGGQTVTATVTVSAPAQPKTYCMVTFDKNGGDTEASPNTMTVIYGGNLGTLPVAGTRNGYTFTGWNTAPSGNGLTFTSGTMITGNITVYAQWTATQNNPNNGDPSGKTTPVETPTNATVVTGTSSSGIISTITVDGKSDASGKVSAAVTEEQVTKAVTEAVEAAAKQGEGTKSDVEIKVTAPADAKTVEASIPKAAVVSVAENKADAMTISAPIADITFDKTALNTISKEATADVKIKASKVDSSNLSEQAKQTVGDRPVFNFSVTSGDKTISQFGGGNVTITVPYVPKDGEDTNAIVIYYINDEGKLQVISNCAYDPTTKTIAFKTTHFSTYAVGYNKVSFKDLTDGAWYNKAVTFMAARGITTGTGDGNYSPNAKLTRGQFIVMTMRAYGISPDTNPSDNFKDAGNTYYTNYLAAAKRLGISQGVGNNMFAPDIAITRQEMFTLLYNVLKSIGELPASQKGTGLSAFSDANKIASWANDAMTLFVKTGTISGSNGKLSPEDTTNRAQMAQVLYNLLSK